MQVLPPTITPEMLSGVVQWASRYTSIVRAWAIGSRAKGTATPEADLDLILELTPGVDSEDAELIHIRQGKQALSAAIGVEVKDIYLRTSAWSRTHGAVEDHGVLLYEWS